MIGFPLYQFVIIYHHISLPSLCFPDSFLLIILYIISISRSSIERLSLPTLYVLVTALSVQRKRGKRPSGKGMSV